jgi:hypothetical protein
MFYGILQTILGVRGHLLPKASLHPSAVAGALTCRHSIIIKHEVYHEQDCRMSLIPVAA